MDQLLFKDEVYAIVGAAIEVFHQLGTGFLEPVYQEALALELGDRGIPFEDQKRLQIQYKHRRLNKKYKADFLCFGQVVVELKALERLGGREESQILNYLKASKLKVGLLLNFGNPKQLEWKRYVY